MNILEIILLSYVLFVQIAVVCFYYLSDTKSKILQIIVFTLYAMCFPLLIPIVFIVDLFKKVVERKHLKRETQEEVKRDDIRFEEAKERVLTKEEKESFKYCGCYSKEEKKINKEEVDKE